MNALRFLLGQAAGVPAAQQGNIIVEGQRQAPVQPPAPPEPPASGRPPQLDRYLMNLDNSEFIKAREQAVRAGEAASDRRGMFGVKGTLRDVLGFLGDSYLVGQGKGMAYLDRREKEKISDAMAGGEFDPKAARARVGYYDPKLEQEMLETYETQKLREAQFESLEAGRQSLIDDRRIKQGDKALLSVQSLLGQPGAIAEDGTITPAAMQALGVLAQRYETTPEELIGDLQGDAARLFSRARINPYQQERLQDYDVGLDQGQQNADSRRISAQASQTRANRPPAPKAEPRDDKAVRIGNKPESERTEGEKIFLRNYQEGTGGQTGPRRPKGSSRQRPSVSNW